VQQGGKQIVNVDDMMLLASRNNGMNDVMVIMGKTNVVLDFMEHWKELDLESEWNRFRAEYLADDDGGGGNNQRGRAIIRRPKSRQETRKGISQRSYGADKCQGWRNVRQLLRFGKDSSR
jgi:hypothetical protein